MSVVSPTTTPSGPSRSSSQLSLDSHLSSPRKRNERSASLDLRAAQDGDNHEGPHYSPALSPHLRMASGFAVKVGIGSPKLDFGRREWIGNKKEEETTAEVEGAPSPAGSASEQDSQSDIHLSAEESSKLPTLPAIGYKVDDRRLSEENSSSEEHTANGDMHRASPAEPPQKPFRRTSTSSSTSHLLRKPSSHSSSSTQTPTTTEDVAEVKTPVAPSLKRETPSRSISSSSSLLAKASDPIKPAGQSHGSGQSSAAMSRNGSHSSSRSLNIKTTPSPRKANVAPIDVHRANTLQSKLTSPEKTAKAVPRAERAESAHRPALDRHDSRRRRSRDSSVEVLEDNHQTGTYMARSRSHGSELDDRIRQAEEKVAQVRAQRPRRSIDVEQRATPSRPFDRYETYTQVTGSPRPSSSHSAIRRNATLSSVVLSDYGLQQAEHAVLSSTSRNGHWDDQENRGKSGGPSSNRPRKGLPNEFRESGLFTPSPQRNGVSANGPNSRSARLREVIESPTQQAQSSPLADRYKPSSQQPNNYDHMASPLRVRSIEGLERSRTAVGTRDGESSAYPRRNWSQSISGLPQARDDIVGPARHRHGAQSVLGTATNGGGSRYGPRASLDVGNLERSVGRRGMSSLSSERDLRTASHSQLGSIAPGDSVSAIGVRSERGDDKDPLEVIRRLEMERAQAKERWNHMPRPATSMSSLREPVGHSPIESVSQYQSYRRSVGPSSPLSPTYSRGPSRARARGSVTEPRSMRSSTSLGSRPNGSLDSPTSTTEHGRLLYEAVRILEAKLNQDSLIAHDLLRTFQSAAKTSEKANASVRQALQLVSQIAVDAELDDTAVSRESYNKLALLLRDAARASEQNVRDTTRIMLDLPKMLRAQTGTGSGMTASTSASSGYLRRSESVMLNHGSDLGNGDKPRRWQPSSPSNLHERSPTQDRYSLDAARREHNTLRASTSMGDAYSPLSRYSRDQQRESSGQGIGGGSTVSSLMSKVRAMTPRKSHTSPNLDPSTIEASPPPPVPVRQAPWSDSRAVQPVTYTPERPVPPSMLRKKASSISTHTVKGSTFLPSTSGGQATTAISQITAGDLSPPSASSGLVSSGTVPDEPNSPMSRFSFRSQRSRSNVLAGGHARGVSDEYDNGRDQSQSQSDEYGGSYETDAVSLLEQRLVQVAQIRDEDVGRDKAQGRAQSHSRRNSADLLQGQPGQSSTDEEGEVERGIKRPSLGDRFRASLRNGPRAE
ncbi:hypothetical protein IAU60_002969 [Kwoniella sp. DSM 27419]